ncbi:two-component system response regulator [Acidisoma sp. L85]|uniref:response regulator n=1 Tax=Acidisoma sp. L85 TaxID=1641850 RepID=UPI00131DA81E|nr:response regulator [Acidisoma sp. L85]
MTGIVLVVDDEFGIAELIDAVLTDEGHRVLTAINGRQGLAMMAKERPDLVFLDYMMPVMDGAEVLSAMAGDPSVAKVPVVLMSSMPETTVAERCSGYTAFMRKPFKIAQVVTLTVKLLNRDGPDGQGAL